VRWQDSRTTAANATAACCSEAGRQSCNAPPTSSKTRSGTSRTPTAADSLFWKTSNRRTPSLLFVYEYKNFNDLV
jgi:hypothetical protein